MRRLLILAAFILAGLIMVSLFVSNPPLAVQATEVCVSGTSTIHDTSPPLTAIVPVATPNNSPQITAGRAPASHPRSSVVITDTDLQPQIYPYPAPPPLRIFEGIDRPGFDTVPDMNGAVGRNEYVQVVNEALEPV